MKKEIIKKGTILKINHTRKGQFYGMAIRNFNTKEEFYPIKVIQLKSVQGMNTEWSVLDKIPCRKSLCTIKIIK